MVEEHVVAEARRRLVAAENKAAKARAEVAYWEAFLEMYADLKAEARYAEGESCGD